MRSAAPCARKAWQEQALRAAQGQEALCAAAEHEALRRAQRTAHRSQRGRPGAWIRSAAFCRDFASFYWEPQRVAAGGWFNPNAMTRGPQVAPFGTKVRVTHLGNGQLGRRQDQRPRTLRCRSHHRPVEGSRQRARHAEPGRRQGEGDRARPQLRLQDCEAVNVRAAGAQASVASFCGIWSVPPCSPFLWRY